MNDQELKYLKDTDFLISKHIISDKINMLLKEVANKLQSNIKDNNLTFPEKVLTKAGKISKGENYRFLPYFILDYPRYFHPEAVFAYRTMFWWGNFFSCTIHLQGTILDNYRSILSSNIEILRDHNVFIAISETPWEYHYQTDNYQLMNKFNHVELQHLINTKSFIKLSRYVSIEEYRQVPEFAEETFILFMKSLKIIK